MILIPNHFIGTHYVTSDINHNSVKKARVSGPQSSCGLSYSTSRFGGRDAFSFTPRSMSTSLVRGFLGQRIVSVGSRSGDWAYSVSECTITAED